MEQLNSGGADLPVQRNLIEVWLFLTAREIVPFGAYFHVCSISITTMNSLSSPTRPSRQDFSGEDQRETVSGIVSHSLCHDCLTLPLTETSAVMDDVERKAYVLYQRDLTAEF